MGKQGKNTPNNQYNDDFYSYQQTGRKAKNQQNYSGNFDDVYSDQGRASERVRTGARTKSRAVVRAKKNRGKGVVAVVFTILIFLVAAIVIFMLQLMLRVNTNNIAKSPEALGINPGVSYGSKVTNIALFGLDDRSNTFQGLSDVIMILTVDQENNKIKMTSVLRDSLVSIDGYGEDKLNHAYSYGGPELAIHTLNQNYQLDIKDYITVNFYNMAGIVDAVGGTKVTITEDEMNEINRNLDMLVAEEAEIEVKSTDYIYENGEVLLNGMQAVAYARIRVLDSDAERAVRQQNVMNGIMTKVKSTSVFGYASLLNSILPMCETSMDASAMLNVAPIILKNFEVESISIPGWAENPTDGHTDAGSWVYIYDRDQAARHLDAFIREEDSEYWQEFS